MEMNRTMFLVAENRDALNSLVACFTWVTTSTENSPNRSRQRGHIGMHREERRDGTTIQPGKASEP